MASHRVPWPGRIGRPTWIAAGAAFVVTGVVAVAVAAPGDSDRTDAAASSTSDPAFVSDSAAASTHAAQATSTATAPAVAPPAGGWVPVDPTDQANRTAAFFARTPKPVTGNPVAVPEFHATCTVSHHANDDPIVFPGLAGASHNHTFWGNTTTDASSTAASIARPAATTCSPNEDHSAYWIPTLYQNGVVVDPDEVTVYYGSRLKDPSKTQPFPPGLRMITGDATKQSDPQGNHVRANGPPRPPDHVRRLLGWPASGQPEPQGPHGQRESPRTVPCQPPGTDPVGVVRHLLPTERLHRRDHALVGQPGLDARRLLQRVERGGTRITGAQLP
jgi:hypothetical protein